MSTGPGRLRRLSARTPLRVKLMAALLALTTVAVVGTGTAATAVLRSYLVDRVDSQLERYSNLALPYMTSATNVDRPHLPTPYYLVLRDAAGHALRDDNAELDGPQE